MGADLPTQARWPKPFDVIAGTYTPLAVALLTGWSRVLLLVLIWVCASLHDHSSNGQI